MCGCWKVCNLNIFEKSHKSGRCPGCHLTHTGVSIIYIYIYIYIYNVHGETSLYVRSPAWLRELHYTGNPYAAAALTDDRMRTPLRLSHSHGSQGLGLEPNKDLVCKDHCNSKEHKNELNFACHASSTVFVQLIF